MGTPEMMRFDAYEKYSVGLRRKLAPDSFYLYNFVVRKDCQKQGLGKKLLQVSHDFMDANGYSTYLETHNPKNVPYYQDYGYALRFQSILPKTKLAHYAMIRDKTTDDGRNAGK